MKGRGGNTKGVYLYGDHKIDQRKPPRLKRSLLSDEIRTGFNEMVGLIVNHSKYPLDWLLSQPICEFYSYIRLIEKEIKRQKQQSDGRH